MKRFKALIAFVCSIALVFGVGAPQVVKGFEPKNVVEFNYQAPADEEHYGADVGAPYQDSKDSYKYIATKGDGYVKGSINGVDYKHLEWNKDDDMFKGPDGETLTYLVPTVKATKSNTWPTTPDTYFCINASLLGYGKITLNFQIGATKKGPANYIIKYFDGKKDCELGTVSLTEGKKMTDVQIKLPEFFNNNPNAMITIKISNTTAISGEDLSLNPSSGCFVVNNISFFAEEEIEIPTTETPTKVPETTKTPTKKKVVAPKRASIKKIYKKKKSAKKLKVKLKKIKGAKGYQVVVFKSKKNAKKNIKALVKKYTKKVKVTLKSKKLKRKKKLFVKARAYSLDGKKKVFGKWSKIKKAKIK